MKRAAVILSGCGFQDGTEIQEACALLVHLSYAHVKVQMFAPDAAQMHVVNHLDGSPTEETRNVLRESARIARGDVTDLADLDVSAFDVAFIPGGFGVAKNLSDWASRRKEFTVLPRLSELIRAFRRAGKPLGMCCIAPVLVAGALPGCEITVGRDQESEKWPYAGTARTLAEMGCKHVNTDVDEAHVDAANKLVTTCAFMCDAPLHRIFDGIGVMVRETLRLA